MQLHAKSFVQPWDQLEVARRIYEMTPDELLGELRTVARNCLGVEPLPRLAGLFPNTVIDLLSDQILLTGTSSRDWENVAGRFLDAIYSSLAIVSKEENPYASLSEIAAIGIAQFTASLHHLSDGSGRLSRIMATIYWPEKIELNEEMVSRLYQGSVGEADHLKSFSDPNLCDGNMAAYYTFGYDKHQIQANGRQGIKVMTVIDHTLFRDMPEEFAQELNQIRDAPKEAFDIPKLGLIAKHYGVRDLFGTLSSRGDVGWDELGLTQTEIEKSYSLADIFQLTQIHFMQLCACHL